VAREQTLSLVAEIRPDDMCAQASAGERHPAWILGHLLLSDAYLLSLLGLRPLTHNFAALLRKYGPGATPLAQLAIYETKAQPISGLEEIDSARVHHVAGMTAEDLALPPA